MRPKPKKSAGHRQSSRLLTLLRDIKGFGAEATRLSFEGPLYATGLWLYKEAVSIAGVTNRKASLLAAGQKQVWRILENITSSHKVIWVHAASLGEFEQGRPIIEKIRAQHPEYKILLTFFSPSGYEVRKNYEGADWVCYLPFDTPQAARRFVNTVRPEKAIFIKYEIWRNYLRQLWKHQIPTYLVSACFRPDQIFFRPTGRWYRAWLRYFTHIFVQDKRSFKLLEEAGFDNVSIAGDTRFDRVAEIAESRKKIHALDVFIGRSTDGVFMAGSSWPADEEVYMPWVNAHPNVKVVIAPHEFDASRLKALKEKCRNGAVLLSEFTGNETAQVLILDCFGLLSSAYAYCSVAYVGGGFGTSIHNINEAAVYGIPVIFGPENHKFIEAQEMKARGGGFEVHNEKEFSSVADLLFTDDAARHKAGEASEAFIKESLGATDRIMERIF